MIKAIIRGWITTIIIFTFFKCASNVTIVQTHDKKEKQTETEVKTKLKNNGKKHI